MKQMLHFITKPFTLPALIVLSLVPIVKAQTTVPDQLQQYINIAMKKNPEVEAAHARWSQADARVGQANSNLWPRVDVTARYTNFSGGRVITLPGLGSFSTAKIAVVPWDNHVDATWPIFNTAVWNARKATRAYLAAADYEIKAKELATAYQVSEAYYSYAKAAELVTVRDNAVKLAKENLATATALFKSDKAQRNDVLRADVAVASAEGDVLQAKNQQALAKTNFNNILNRNYDESIELPPAETVAAMLSGPELASRNEGSPPASLEQPAYQSDLDQALRTRPELLQLENTSSALEGYETVNASDYYPNVALFATYGFQEDKLNFSSQNDYFAGGFQFKWNLFNGFNTSAKVAETEGQLEELTFQKEGAINGIRMELQNARLERQNTRDRREVATRQLQSAEENYRITKLQYDAGTVPLINMIDAESTLANAKANRSVTTYDVLIADAKYRKALGN